MLRHSLKLRIKPYLHAFSPGARASEKGFLYRNNNQNAHGRVASIQNAQRTYREHRIFTFLLIPDQMITCFVMITLSITVFIVGFRNGLFSNSTQHTHRAHNNGLSPHELFRRNEEMRLIFENHSALLENGKELVGAKPDVLNAPGEYVSPSGRFSKVAVPS